MLLIRESILNVSNQYEKMRRLKIFQVDAFTSEVFGGNPAAVVPLDNWIADKELQSIAAENNLAETAFLVPMEDGWELRWFTPAAEVALCGHATLAAAHVLVTHLNYAADSLRFETRQSGTLVVTRLADGSMSMSFPAISLAKCNEKNAVSEALGETPESVEFGRYSPDQIDYVAVFDSEQKVASLNPDFAKFRSLNSRGIIATSPGSSCDFVSRYFAPNFGIDEDPVTGSAHCLLTPYWSKRLGKQSMQARQISRRGGEIACTLGENDRVLLAGYAVDYLVGEITF